MGYTNWKNLPDQSTPITASNLNNDNDFSCNMITTTCADTSIVTTQDQKREDIPVDIVLSSVGDKLTLNTANNKHEVKIGAGVSYVSVSCSCAVVQASSGMTYQALTILKNGSQYGKWANCRGNTGVYLYTTLSDILIPVQEGDAISIALFNRVAGTVNLNNVYLTVKVIK